MENLPSCVIDAPVARELREQLLDPVFGFRGEMEPTDRFYVVFETGLVSDPMRVASIVLQDRDVGRPLHRGVNTQVVDSHLPCTGVKLFLSVGKDEGHCVVVMRKHATRRELGARLCVFAAVLDDAVQELHHEFWIVFDGGYPLVRGQVVPVFLFGSFDAVQEHVHSG